MPKKKPKRERVKYLKGATWRDVLAGKPVTRAETTRPSKSKKSLPSKCRDCGETDVVPKFRYYQATPPKCAKCGGLMEYQGRLPDTRRGPVVRTGKPPQAPSLKSPPA